MVGLPHLLRLSVAALKRRKHRLDRHSGRDRGERLAEGYPGFPDLTAERFIANPFTNPGAPPRLYRTGDLVDQDEAGNFYYHGRIDAQVKLRGYRIELGEIESRLAALPGVRAAACRLQGEGAGAELVAFIVPDQDDNVPAADLLRQELAATLPAYMVPQRIGVLAELPTSVSGKLDRKALPQLGGQTAEATAQDIVGPDNEMEALLAAGYADILKRPAVSVLADFFTDLGGDSLSAAMLVTLLRENPATAWVTVSDIYEARSARALAALTPPAGATRFGRAHV